MKHLGTLMPDSEWSASRVTRQRLSELVGFAAWSEFSAHEADEAVRRAKVVGVEAVAKELIGDKGRSRS
jgi:hypothetical protein